MDLLSTINPLVARLGGSRIREVANAGMARSDVLAFWFGEPHEVTPAAIRDAASRSLAQGETFYSANTGLPELRMALASYIQSRHPSCTSSVDSAAALSERVVVTSAGMNALMLAVQTLVVPGDRVLAVVPLWPNLEAAAQLMGARVQRVSLTVDHHTQAWQLDLDALLAAIATRPRLLMLNSPNNPTGWCATAQQMQAIVAACRAHGVWLLSDEAYERLYYLPGARFGQAPSALDYCHTNDPVIVANTFSKTWQMTGWRLGWLVLPGSLTPQVAKLVEFNTSCAPVFVQRAGLAALAMGEAPIGQFVETLARRRRFLLDALAQMPGIELPEAHGAMYAFFKVLGQHDSLALAKRLVEQFGLGLAPGSAFGQEGEGWLRWCYAKPEPMLEQGLERLQRALS